MASILQCLRQWSSEWGGVNSRLTEGVCSLYRCDPEEVLPDAHQAPLKCTTSILSQSMHNWCSMNAAIRCSFLRSAWVQRCWMRISIKANFLAEISAVRGGKVLSSGELKRVLVSAPEASGKWSNSVSYYTTEQLPPTDLKEHTHVILLLFCI